MLDLPDVKDGKLMVMPLLRMYDSPSWDTFGEVVAFWEQIFEVCAAFILHYRIQPSRSLGNSFYAHQSHRPSVRFAYSDLHGYLTYQARDCTVNNIMLDPTKMYIDSFHPAQPDKRRDWKGPARYRTRTQRPPRYYLIDFGLSKVYAPEDGPPRDIPVQGGDKSVPEFANDSQEPYDPFPVDVYYLGNWIREYFMDVSGSALLALSVSISR
jgi:hypothetical protein